MGGNDFFHIQADDDPIALWSSSPSADGWTCWITHRHTWIPDMKASSFLLAEDSLSGRIERVDGQLVDYTFNLILAPLILNE